VSENGKPPRDDDAVTERDPETQGSEVAEATEDEANQPGQLMGVFLLFRDLWRLFRGEKQRTRKLRWLFGLLRPYRGRVIVMGIALLIATAAGLAPPYLAGLAIDEGIRKGDLSTLGTTLNGRHVPRGVDDNNGVKRENGQETALPARARIGLAETVFLDFEQVIR